MLADVLEKSLGVFSRFGFSLEEDCDTAVILRHNGGLVDYFTPHVTIAAIQNSCQAHLIAEHGATYIHEIEEV